MNGMEKRTWRWGISALWGRDGRRLTAMVLSVCLVWNLMPVPTAVLAAEAGIPPGAGAASVCGHVHDDSCGYREAKEGRPCSHLNEDGSYGCAPIVDEDELWETATPGNATPSDADAGDYGCDHTDDCGYEEAAEESPCTHSCELCEKEKQAEAESAAYEKAVALFAALPKADSITEGMTEEALDAILAQIDEAMTAFEELNDEDYARFVEKHSGLLEAAAALNAAITGAWPVTAAKNGVIEVDGERITLSDAIRDAGDGDTLKIMKDIDLGSTGVTISGKSLTIDLNGKTISSDGRDDVIQLQKHAGLTVKDGTGGGKLEAPNAHAIGNYSDGAIRVMGGSISAHTAICNLETGAVHVSGGTVLSAENEAIYNDSTGKIVISGDAVVTSGNVIADSGTIRLKQVPGGDPETILEIKDKAVVENTAGAEYYAVYFADGKVTPENLDGYYTAEATAKVGRVYPELVFPVELYDNDGNKKGSYSDLRDAVIAADDDDKLKIMTDMNLDSSVTIQGKTLTLDLNGNTVTWSEENGGLYLADMTWNERPDKCANLTVTDSRGQGMIKSTNDYGYAITNDSFGNVTVSGGTIKAEGSNGVGIKNIGIGSVTIAGGRIEATGTGGVAIRNQEVGEITISGSAKVMSGNTESNQGTILLERVPGGDIKTILEIKDTAEVENTAGADYYAVYFEKGVDSYNVRTYCTVEAGATVGRIYPEPAFPVELWRGDKKAGGYDTLAEAIAEAQDDDKLKIMTDIDLGSDVAIQGKTLTLDLNGNTVTWSQGYSGLYLKDVKGEGGPDKCANLTVTDSQGQGMITSTVDYACTIVNNSSGNVTVSGAAIKAEGNYSVAIRNIKTGGVHISDGVIGATGERDIAIENNGSGDVMISDGEICTTGAPSVAIRNASEGQIKLSGSTWVRSRNTESKEGTILLEWEPRGTIKTILKIEDTAKVENTAGSEYYAVYFTDSNITPENVLGYCSIAEGTTVGKIYPEPAKAKAVELWRGKEKVEDYAALAEAIEAAADSGDMLKIVVDINLGDTGVTIDGKNLTLDLNGKTVTYTGIDSAIALKNDGAGLTVKDDVSGGKLIATNGKVILNESAGDISILGGEITANGDGTNTIVNKLAGDLNISGGKIVATGKGSRTIWNITAGNINVSGGEISAVGTDSMAIINSATGKITVSGSAVITSGMANSLYGTIFIEKVPEGGNLVILDIQGGTVANTATDGYSVYFDDSSVIPENVQNYYTVAEGAEVGRIYPEPAEIKAVELWRGDKKAGGYDTLAEAIAEAQDDDMLKITKDINLGDTGVTIEGKSLTLNLNGRTITYPGDYSAVTLNAGAMLMVTDSGTGGRLEATGQDGKAISNRKDSKVTISGGKVEAVNTAIENLFNGTVDVSGGKVEAAVFAIYNNETGTIIISGGEIKAGEYTIANSRTGEVIVRDGMISTETGHTIRNSGTGTVNISGGDVTADSGIAIVNISTGGITISGGTVSAVNGVAIDNGSTGKIAIGDHATVTSANTDRGTIYFGKVPESGPKTILVIGEAATVENTANPAGYSVYFADREVTPDNVRDYYTVAETATVGKIYPEQAIITDVTVSPATVKVQKGAKQQFTATVKGTNAPAQTVTWSVSGSDNAGTGISEDGLLTVAADERAQRLTITATSTLDTGKSGTAAVTVIDMPVTKYRLTVINGSGSGEYEAGAQVAIHADAAPEGQRFKGWKAEGSVKVADPSSADTTVIMPAGEAAVTAVYEVVPVVDTSSIEKAISAAEAARTGITVSDKPVSSISKGTRFVTTAEMQALNDAIATAEAAIGKVTTTEEAEAAARVLETAVAVFEAAIKVGTHTSGSGGGGGGSSGGGSTSGGTVIPSTAGKQGSLTTAQTELMATVDANGNATVTLSETAVEEAVTQAEEAARKNGTPGSGISLVIHVAMGGNEAAVVTVNLPKATQEIIISKKISSTVLVVDNPSIQLSMDLTAVTEVNRQANADVNITAARIDKSRFTGSARTAIGSRPAFELTAGYGGGQITTFGAGTVSVTIPYTLRGGETAGGVYAVYVDGSGNGNALAASVYDANTGLLHFKTNHFSIYGVGYKASADFADIADHWAKGDIQFAASRGLLTGTSAGAFSPDAPATAGALATAVGSLVGADMGSVLPAAGLTADQAVTREQMAVILSGCMDAAGIALPEVYEATLFADADAIAPASAGAVRKLQMAGVIAGKNANRFAPQDAATRAEAAAVLHRLTSRMTGASTAQGWTQNDDGQWMYYENGRPVKNQARDVDGKTYNFDAYGVTIDYPGKQGITYTVKAGDSFWGIARAYQVDMYALAELNGKSIHDEIHPGEVLKIPE